MPTFEETQNTNDGYMHTSYKGLSREDADKKALNDLWEYVGSVKGTDIIIELINEVRTGTKSIQNLNMTLGMAGVSGTPFHALCRRHLLTRYREWMHSGSDAVRTDEQGFPTTVAELKQPMPVIDPNHPDNCGFDGPTGAE